MFVKGCGTAREERGRQAPTRYPEPGNKAPLLGLESPNRYLKLGDKAPFHGPVIHVARGRMHLVRSKVKPLRICIISSVPKKA